VNGHALADQGGDDIRLEIRKAENKVRPEVEIFGISAEMNAETRVFSRRASGGRTQYPDIPTIRRCSPSRYSVSTVSSVKQTIRSGGNTR
jgi:hypothetical protein